MTTTDRSPALAALDVLVGSWTVRPVPPPEWGVVDPDAMAGGVTFEWALGGAYLVGRSHAPDPVPDSMTVIAPDGDGYRQHYYDSRGVTRLYRMTLADGVWTLLRTEPDFSPLDFAQRFVGEFDPDATTIAGRWEQSHDGGRTWELDFELTYRR
ncbi:hypothetical protein [Pseudonocardia lacus]|uniref:hypothetical protein n=1 Tax=Pseudonocardia lacus TaxID=2835865 RepID=UPI001BDBCD8C|nr:hypothetical protein [Pseudonocardia lacus]